MTKLAPAQALPTAEPPVQTHNAAAADLDDLPRQLAAVTRLYEHERSARIELEQRLAARATELEIINGIGQALAQQRELQAVIDLVGDKIRETLRPETIDIRLYDRRSNLIHTPYQYDAGHRSSSSRSHSAAG